MTEYKGIQEPVNVSVTQHQISAPWSQSAGAEVPVISHQPEPSCGPNDLLPSLALPLPPSHLFPAFMCEALAPRAGPVVDASI